MTSSEQPVDYRHRLSLCHDAADSSPPRTTAGPGLLPSVAVCYYSRRDFVVSTISLWALKVVGHADLHLRSSGCYFADRAGRLSLPFVLNGFSTLVLASWYLCLSF